VDSYLELKENECNSVQLEWTNSTTNIRGYHIFKNNERITDEMLTETEFFDENLVTGDYEYYVRTYYETGCISDSSNHVKIIIEDVGVEKLDITDRIEVYQTTDKLQVTSYKLQVKNIEIFDIYGRIVGAFPCGRPDIEINISHLPRGIYFIKIITEKEIISKKIIINYFK
jgi:hypothetical protein